MIYLKNRIYMMSIDNFTFWDIVSAEIPFTDWTNTKIRPVLILYKDKEDYLVLRISSILPSMEDLDIKLVPNSENNLKTESIIKLKKIGLFNKYVLRKKIGILNWFQKDIVKKHMKKFVDIF